MTAPFPERPKGMHEWTYTRLACRALAAEVRASNTLLAQFDRSKRAAKDQTLKEAAEAPETGSKAAAVQKNSYFAFDLDVTAGKPDTSGGMK